MQIHCKILQKGKQERAKIANNTQRLISGAEVVFADVHYARISRGPNTPNQLSLVFIEFERRPSRAEIKYRCSVSDKTNARRSFGVSRPVCSP